MIHEQTQWNQVWYIFIMGDFRASKVSSFQNLFYVHNEKISIKLINGM